jgi:hypothetical protein
MSAIAYLRILELINANLMKLGGSLGNVYINDIHIFYHNVSISRKGCW